MTLRNVLLRERGAESARLLGGYPIPLIGIFYWAALGLLGTRLSPDRWTFWAFILSGPVFPLVLLFARIFRNELLPDRNPVSGVLSPALLAVLLFWPIAIAAWWTDVQLVPLILAIGMSLHWPVVGWSYGRTGLYTAHAFVRTIVCFLIWWLVPEGRFPWLPLSVSAIYLLTVAAIIVDSRRSQNSQVKVRSNSRKSEC
jgi:hypothetical protein